MKWRMRGSGANVRCYSISGEIHFKRSRFVVRYYAIFVELLTITLRGISGINIVITIMI